MFSLSLLQNSNYNLGERLIILGMAYKKIEALHREKRIHELPMILENINQIITEGSFKEELAIKLIQSFSKVVLHNDRYIQGIIKLLKDSGYDTLAYMSILVKN